MNRVAITGMAGITPLGNDWPTVLDGFETNRSAVKHIEEWQKIPELGTKIAAPAEFELYKGFKRKHTRTMGRVAQMAATTAQQALEQAGLIGAACLTDGSTGVSYGSCAGSSAATLEFAAIINENTLSKLNSSSYPRMMSHTTAVNIAVTYGLQGRVYTTSSACTSGSQGVGYGFEAIKLGMQDVMVCGGAEELCPSQTAAFYKLLATSSKNDAPTTTPAPFDANRDGLIIGEGACTLVLENYDHAVARGATILAEVVGYATNCDGTHVTQPNTDTMERAMRQALKSASLSAEDIGYVCAHGTATDRGDIAESQAVERLFGDKPLVSSLKGHFGHTLGGCGAIESWLTVEMLNAGRFSPTLNLSTVDERCGDLNYVMGEMANSECDYAMNNNFAFGGINTSLVFKRAR